MRSIIFTLIFIASYSVVAVAFAIDEKALVTCDGVTVEGVGVSCNFCHFVLMIDKVAKFIVSILIIISVIMLAVTGIQMAYTAAGGSDAREILKDRLTNIVIGFVIILGAWVIVDTLLKALVTDGDIRNNWNKPIAELCGYQEAPGSRAPGGIFAEEGPGSTLSGATKSHAEAESILNAAGINIFSSGSCSDKTVSTCTSLDGISQRVIDDAIELKSACGCEVTITGGTEVGHSSGHTNGDKYDVRITPQVDAYIYSNFTPAGTRSDGAAIYIAPNGITYYREGDHWDIDTRTMR